MDRKYVNCWCLVTVALLAGTASAQPMVWLEASGGLLATTGGHLVLDGVSSTGIIQLWLDVPAGVNLLGMAAIMLEYDAGWGPNTSFEIQAYNPTGLPLPNNWNRNAPHGNEGALPNAHFGVDQYQFIGDTLNWIPWTDADSIQGPATVLLDEIVIHGTGLNRGSPDFLTFGFGAQAPQYFDIYWMAVPPPGAWTIGGPYSLNTLTGGYPNVLLIESVPEPTTLSLLLLGGLAALRRHRTT